MPLQSEIRPFRLLTQILGLGRIEEVGFLLSSARQRIHWEQIVSLANEYLMTPALWCALNDKQLVNYLPDAIRDYLQELYDLNANRNMYLRVQAEEAIQQLNCRGISPVLLKGAVYLLEEDHYVGSRIMTDLDILVGEHNLEPAILALSDVGYRADAKDVSKYAKHHHYAPMYRSGDYGAIELHRELLLVSVSHYLYADDAIRHAETVNRNNIEYKILNPRHALMHNFIHSQIVDRCHSSGYVNLRALSDLARMSIRHTLEWSALEEMMHMHGKQDMVRAYAKLAHGLLNIPCDGYDFGVRARLNELRCRLRTDNAVYELMDDKLQRFSAYHINQRYQTGESGAALMLGRLRYISDLILRRAPPDLA